MTNDPDMISIDADELDNIEGGNDCWPALLLGLGTYFWCRYWGEITNEVMRDYPDTIA